MQQPVPLQAGQILPASEPNAPWHSNIVLYLGYLEAANTAGVRLEKNRLVACEGVEIISNEEEVKEGA